MRIDNHIKRTCVVENTILAAIIINHFFGYNLVG